MREVVNSRIIVLGATLVYIVLVALYTPVPPVSLRAAPDTIALVGPLAFASAASGALLATSGRKNRLLGVLGAGLATALAVSWLIEAGVIVLVALLPLAGGLARKDSKQALVLAAALGLPSGILVPLAYGLTLDWSLVYAALSATGALLGYATAAKPPETGVEKIMLSTGIAAAIALGLLLASPLLYAHPVECKTIGTYYGKVLGASLPGNETRILLLLGWAEEKCFVLINTSSIGLGGEKVPLKLLPFYLKNRYLVYTATSSLPGPVKIVVAGKAKPVASPLTGTGFLVLASSLGLVALAPTAKPIEARRENAPAGEGEEG